MHVQDERPEVTTEDQTPPTSSSRRKKARGSRWMRQRLYLVYRQMNEFRGCRLNQETKSIFENSCQRKCTEKDTEEVQNNARRKSRT